MTSAVMRLHCLAVEASAARSFAVQAEQFEEAQREALLRLVALQRTTGDERSPNLTQELGAALTGACAGVSAVWVHPDFVAPLVASAAYSIVSRLDAPDIVLPRPVLVREPSAAYGLRLQGFELPAGSTTLREESRSLFVQATVRASLRSLKDPAYVLEAMGDLTGIAHIAYTS